MTTEQLYQSLAERFRDSDNVVSDTEPMEIEHQTLENLDETLRQSDAQVPGVNGITVEPLQSEEPETSWSRWEDCVTVVSKDTEKRPIFVLPFVDIPDDDPLLESLPSME